MTDTAFLAPVATQTVHFDLPEGDVSVSVFPHAGPTWRDHRAPHATDAALKRCATRYSRRRDAQAVYAKHLRDLFIDVVRDPNTAIPDDMARDLGEMLEGRAIDEARKQQVKARVLAELGERRGPRVGGVT